MTGQYTLAWSFEWSEIKELRTAQELRTAHKEQVMLSTEPVRRLHEEYVRRSRIEDVADVAARGEIADGLEPASLLLPHEEQS